MSLSTGSRRISSESPAHATMTSPAGRAVSDAQFRRRLAAPLLDFVSALRLAISAFGQGQVGSARTPTLRQVAEIMSLLERPLKRGDAAATRILYLGDLSPHSGVVDFLACVIPWAERHPDIPIDVCWAGCGDLQGVLRAQVTPPNLTQSFTRLSGPDAVAALAGDRGILAVPNSGHVELLPLAQAVATGLPVLGSVRCPEARMLVISKVTGWLFDPLSPQEISSALDAALTTPPIRLAEMSAAARRRLGALCDEWLGADDETNLPPNPNLLTTSGQV